MKRNSRSHRDMSTGRDAIIFATTTASRIRAVASRNRHERFFARRVDAPAKLRRATICPRARRYGYDVRARRGAAVVLEEGRLSGSGNDTRSGDAAVSGVAGRGRPRHVRRRADRTGGTRGARPAGGVVQRRGLSGGRSRLCHDLRGSQLRRPRTLQRGRPVDGLHGGRVARSPSRDGELRRSRRQGGGPEQPVGDDARLARDPGCHARRADRRIRRGREDEEPARPGGGGRSLHPAKGARGRRPRPRPERRDRAGQQGRHQRQPVPGRSERRGGRDGSGGDRTASARRPKPRAGRARFSGADGSVVPRRCGRDAEPALAGRRRRNGLHRSGDRRRGGAWPRRRRALRCRRRRRGRLGHGRARRLDRRTQGDGRHGCRGRARSSGNEAGGRGGPFDGIGSRCRAAHRRQRRDRAGGERGVGAASAQPRRRGGARRGPLAAS